MLTVVTSQALAGGAIVSLSSEDLAQAQEEGMCRPCAPQGLGSGFSAAGSQAAPGAGRKRRAAAEGPVPLLAWAAVPQGGTGGRKRARGKAAAGPGASQGSVGPRLADVLRSRRALFEQARVHCCRSCSFVVPPFGIEFVCLTVSLLQWHFRYSLTPDPDQDIDVDTEGEDLSDSLQAHAPSAVGSGRGAAKRTSALFGAVGSAARRSPLFARGNVDGGGADDEPEPERAGYAQFPTAYRLALSRVPVVLAEVGPCVLYLPLPPEASPY